MFYSCIRSTLIVRESTNVCTDVLSLQIVKKSVRILCTLFYVSQIADGCIEFIRAITISPCLSLLEHNSIVLPIIVLDI